jgi:hypothetical protein
MALSFHDKPRTALSSSQALLDLAAYIASPK